MKDWKKTLVQSGASIREAIRVIDSGSAQIALVADPDGRLLGTVTDGDVRRGILRGVSLDDPVDRVMRQTPVTAKKGEKRESVLSLMKGKQIYQIPVLDEKACIVGLEIMNELLRTETKDNRVILMAGGLGTRLRPLTEHTPKPLIPVGEKPILEIILDNFIEDGFVNFTIAVNHQDRMIRQHFGDGSRWGVRIDYLAEKERRGTAGALSLLDERPEMTFFVMNADLLTKVNFLQLLNFHRENGAEATMCVREYDFQVPYGVVKIDGHHIQGIDEKPLQRFFVNAGIYVLEPSAIGLIPTQEPFDMTQLFEKVIQKKGQTAAFPIREYWIDIGRLSDLERAQGEYSSVFQ